MTTTLIVGCGYLGRAVGRLLLDRAGDRVFGTTRTPSKIEVLEGLGIEPVLADIHDPATLDRLPAVDRAFYCVAAGRGSGDTSPLDSLGNVLPRLAERAGRLVFASSTGVYGQQDGSWVDESSPPCPRDASGRAALAAEDRVRTFAAERGWRVAIIRFAGLYGPGRIIRKASVRAGEPIAGDPDGWLNLIHVHDAAEAATAALDRAEARAIYLAADDCPVRRRDYYGLLAKLLQAPTPRFQPPASGAGPGPRREANKRVSNRRMRTELRVDLAYPNIQAGLPAALAAEGSMNAP